MKKIGIIGCGWLGSRIAASMTDEYVIYTTATNQQKTNELNAKGFNAVTAVFADYQLTEPCTQWKVIHDLDAVIITIPISDKSCCVSSLYNRLQNLSSFIGDFTGPLFLMSSTGVYPDISGEFTEEDVPVEKVPGERMIKSRYPQANILRLGGLMGDNRLLKNYKVSNPDFAVNHIHYADIASVIDRMIKKGIVSELYNVTAPSHPPKEQVMNAQNNLPYIEGEAVKGKKILSAKLSAGLDFDFQYPDPKFFHL